MVPEVICIIWIKFKILDRSIDLFLILPNSGASLECIVTLWMRQVLLMVSGRRKAAAAASQSQSSCKVDDTQLEFSESMRRTRDVVARTGGCLSRCCCSCCSWSLTADTQDKYAVDVLATEVDSLKRAVREVSQSIHTVDAVRSVVLGL